MQIDQYLDKIGFEGRPRVDFDTLVQVHRRHLRTFPYENLSVQLGQPVGLEIGPIFEKLVRSPRGGWCYEMNGLLGWALEQLGFDVMRMTGGVMRDARGDEDLGDHLALCVQLDRPYLADAGLLDGLAEPIPIESGEYQQGFLQYRLEKRPDGYWRFHNQPDSGVNSFDFRFEPGDEALFARKSKSLQTSPDSLFVTTLVCGRFIQDGIQLLIGRVRKHVTAAGVESKLLESSDELVHELDHVFGIRVDGVAELWPQILRRHEQVFGNGDGAIESNIISS